MWMLLCRRNSVLGIRLSNSSFVFIFIYIFPLYPSVLAPSPACRSPASYSLSDSSGVKLQLRSLQCPNSALDTSDTVSDLDAVSVSCGLDAVVYADTQPSLPTPFISLCFSSPSVSSLVQ